MDEVLAVASTVVGQTKVNYVHSNHLYSVAALTDTAGNVVERYTYNAYGKQTVRGATGNVIGKSSVGYDRGFTGYVADNETGLLHARARQYSPGLGRFMGRDEQSMVFEGLMVFAGNGYLDGYSLYRAYFAPNTLDPSGAIVWGETFPHPTIPFCKCDDEKAAAKKYSWAAGSVNPEVKVYDTFEYTNANGKRRKCTRTDENMQRTRNHENQHAENDTAKMAALNAKYTPFGPHDSMQACVDKRREMVKEWNDWSGREQNHSNPESPPVGGPWLPKESADSEAAGKCADVPVQGQP